MIYCNGGSLVNSLCFLYTIINLIYISQVKQWKKKIPYDVMYASLSSLFASYIFPSAPMSLTHQPSSKVAANRSKKRKIE